MRQALSKYRACAYTLSPVRVRERVRERVRVCASVSVSACACACACVCVSVSVWRVCERERKRKRVRTHSPVCVCVCRHKGVDNSQRVCVAQVLRVLHTLTPYTLIITTYPACIPLITTHSSSPHTQRVPHSSHSACACVVRFPSVCVAQVLRVLHTLTYYSLTH